MTASNQEIVRRAFEAFTARDLDTAAEYFAEDMKYHLGGSTPISGDRTGRDRFFGLAAQVDIEPRFDLHDILANDEHAVVLFRTQHKRQGKPIFEQPGVWVSHLADGKITEVWSFPFDLDAVREFLS